MRIARETAVPYADPATGEQLTFWFVEPAEALADLTTAAVPLAQEILDRAAAEKGRPLAPEEQAEALASVQVTEADAATVPPEFLRSMLAVFSEGCVRWDGLTDDSDIPLPCTAETKRLLPMEVRVSVAMGYCLIRTGLAQKKG